MTAETADEATGNPTDRTPRLSRRDALRLAGAAGVAGMAGTTAGAGRAAAQEATPAPAPGAITVPQSGAALPTDEVTFRWVDSGDLKALFYTRFFPAYQAAHPNITVQYDQLPWEQIAQVVPLGVRNGNAHDVFQLPLNVPAAQAVQEGWVAPLDDLIPDFAAWQTRFPFGALLPGIHAFDGKTYTFPLTSNKRYSTLTLYNVELMERAGYDPGSEPLTWDGFREAARTVTEQGQGRYFGVLLWGQSTQRFAEFVRNLGRFAGGSASGVAPLADVDWRTGEYAFAKEEYLAAIDLLLALRDDNSVFPGSTSLVEAEARSLFPQGVAGMIPEGPWNIPQWQREAPDFRFGIAGLPVPNAGAPVPITFEETGANQVWVFADSDYKAIAADMLSYIGSPEGQAALVVATGGNLRSVFPEANEVAQRTQQLDPLASRALTLFEEQIRLGPMPVLRNPDLNGLLLELRPLTPDFGATVQGIYAGQLDDPRRAMEELKDRAEAELDRAIAAAQAKGAQVSRDDLVFANWDPSRDYTEADYQAL